MFSLVSRLFQAIFYNSPNIRQKENMSFKNKVILITGASSGIGKGLALYFAQQEGKVVINYKSSHDAAKKVASKIDGFSGESLTIQADVTQRSEVQSMVSRILSEYGQIDILINNAGGVYEPASWNQVKQSDFNETVQLNLTSVFNCISEVAPQMRKLDGGKIVTISSIAGFMGGAQAPAYTAAKAGSINLTKAFAKELAPSINVNCVAPGWVNTNWHCSKGEDFFKMVKRETPLKRIGKVEDIVRSVSFLASKQAEYITGQTLVVDGGISLK